MNIERQFFTKSDYTEYSGVNAFNPIMLYYYNSWKQFNQFEFINIIIK